LRSASLPFCDIWSPSMSGAARTDNMSAG
jgi:hypothetical protein